MPENLTPSQQAIFSAALRGPLTEEVFQKIFAREDPSKLTSERIATAISRLNRRITPKRIVVSGSANRPGGISTYRLILPDAD